MVLAILLGSLLGANSQTITGSIGGVVTDPSGAVVSGAIVQATNTATNVTTTGKTNRAGIYSIRFLPIGTYGLKIQAKGFSDWTFSQIVLNAGQTANVNASLAVAGAQKRVVVSGGLAPLLNTQNAELGTTLNSVAINNVPLVSRNFSTLTLFVPGAVTVMPSGFTGANALERTTSQTGMASMNGNRFQANNYTLDGIEINETVNNTIGYSPSPDALAQVRIISANAPAEFGNVTGGDVLALLKSGSNHWHGSAFSYLGDWKLDANTWANKHTTPIIPRSHYTQNIFGGTLGGPIIPNKLFFFTDYSGTRYHLGGQAAASVATAKMRTGDFSELLNPSLITKPIQLYDSANGFKPYAGNLNVPVLNPVAAYLYAHPDLYPLPNANPIPGTVTQNNYHGPQKSRIFNDQFDVKLDWQADASDRISGSYSQSIAGDTSTNPLVITFPGANNYPSHVATLNWVKTFSPFMVNEARAGYTRIVWRQGAPNDTTGTFGTHGNSLMGIPGVQTLEGFSEQNLSGQAANGGGLTALGNLGNITTLVENTFTYGDVLTWQVGKHLVKVGAQFIRDQQNQYFPGGFGAAGEFIYTGGFTSNPGATPATNPNGYLTNGFALADFNLDRVFSLGIGSTRGLSGQRQWRSAYFAQDDYKILPNLTLNFGLRYAYDQPIYEVHNEQANVNLDTKAIELAGVNGASRALYNPYYADFEPRVGFAYSATPRLVIRGGFGTTEFLEGMGSGLRLNFNPPFFNSFTVVGTAPSATSSGQFFRVEDGFQPSLVTGSGTTIHAWTADIRPAVVSDFSLTTEYQLSNNASLSVGYVGEIGRHLVSVGRANQLMQPCVIGGVIQSTPNSAACAAINPAPYGSLVGQSGALTLTASNAMMNYNGLQATIQDRMSRGLQFTVNYAYGLAMTDANGFFSIIGIEGPSSSAQNFYNQGAEYGPVDQDTRNNLNGVVVWQLPFGRGQAFGANVNRLTDEVIGGWKLAMTAIAYSGFPVTINNSSNNAFTNNAVQRAEHLRRLKIRNRSTNDWFGTDPSATSCNGVNSAGLGIDNGVCAYGSPSDGTYGTASVGSQRAPGLQEYDMSAAKEFTIRSEQKLGFRVDAANVFNITSLGAPNRVAQSANFGQITSVDSQPRQLQLSVKYEF